MTNKNILDYFDKVVEFPTEQIINPFPFGELWHYVSSTYLNGFVNHITDVIAVFQIDRYTAEAEIVKTSYTNELSGSTYFEGTKQELRDIVRQDIAKFSHTDLNMFADDIIILGHISSNNYVLFYYDCDVSDCKIGKFKTSDSVDDIRQSIINYLDKEKSYNEDCVVIENMDNGIINWCELPKSFISGWVSF